MSKLLEKFNKQIKPTLAKEFGFENQAEVPKIVKVVVGMGVKEGAKDKSVLEKMKNQLAAIAGQMPYVCRARKSIAAFNLVAGNLIGLAVTLRGKKMYDFLEKLFTIVLPRTRDFRGVSPKSFDSKGNYNSGLSEMTVFPEVDYSQLDKSRGLQVTIVTNTDDNKEAKRLLEELGLPFAK